MSVQEVTSLRKAGKLNEAFDLARRELDEDPNEWTRMSLFWVLRDWAIKQYLPANKVNETRCCLEQMERLLPDMIDDNGAGKAACQHLHRLLLPNANEVENASDLSKTNPDEAYSKMVELFGKNAEKLEDELHEKFGWVLYRYMKANSDQLTSVQIRCLLRDYMQLRNERPSLIHSTFLNYAVNFSKGHADFSFYKFFILWDAKNLRYEDYVEGWAENHKISSLTSRICKTIIESDVVFDVSGFVSKFERKDTIIEDLRQAYFWKLMSLHKENKLDKLFQDFAYYAENYSALGPSHWHSEILKIANRFMIDGNSSNFVPFMMKWDCQGNLRDEDWVKETNDEGKIFPSLAVKSAKKCYDILKATQKDLIPNATLAWLKDLYEKVKEHDSDDDWSVRNYATICAWCGKVAEAITLYKSLLLHMGDKYYLWAELANLLPNNSELEIGLLLKAKRLEKNEDFLGDIHLALASLWQKEGYGSIAQKELEAYATHRIEKGWGVSDKYRELQANTMSCANKMDKVDFNYYINIAEDFVYGEFDWIDFVVTDKWTLDKIEHCNLVDGGKNHLCIKTKRFPKLKNANIGDVIQFRCNIIEEVNFGTTYRMHRTINEKKINPLVCRTTNKEAWSILPIKYGVIDYVNEQKKTLHIITQESKQIYFKFKEKAHPVDSFVKFREYEDLGKDEIRTCIANLEQCSSDEALRNMPNRVVVVDDVNNAKKLFHVVLGRGKISDVVRFDQTDIRPAIGDYLRITYCVKKNKEGKKRIKFLDIQTSEIGCNGVKDTVTGRLEVKYHDEYCNYNEEPDFAFVKDIYVHRSILKKYKITSDCDVIAKVVLGGDDKWKVYDLEFPE